MPQANFQQFIYSQLDAASKATSEGARRSALRQYFYAVLSEVAEDVIDNEMTPVNGSPTPPKFALRPDSSYYPYNMARANGYASFTDEQRAVLRGLVMRTAFEVLDGIFYSLDFLPDAQLEMRIVSEADEGVESVILSQDTDELQYGRNYIPKGLTKYEI
jgi:hypothetical protein